jgi:hypothetical protein
MPLDSADSSCRAAAGGKQQPSKEASRSTRHLFILLLPPVWSGFEVVTACPQIAKGDVQKS